MDTKLEIHIENVNDLIPYAHNAKIHTEEQVDTIVESIKEFGNCDPIAVWHNKNGAMEIVEGHGRVLALKKLGYTKAPVIYLDHLSDEQRRAYTHVHNQTTLNSDFNFTTLDLDLATLDFDFNKFGFVIASSPDLEIDIEDDIEPKDYQKEKRGIICPQCGYEF